MNKETMREVMYELLSETATLKNTSEGIDTTPIIETIERAFGNIYIPEPKVTVNVPKIDVMEVASKIKLPEEMSVRGWVQLQGVDLANPLPVQLRDANGSPVNLFDHLTQIVSGGGSGGSSPKTMKISGNDGVDIGDVTLNNSLNAGNADASTIRVIAAKSASATTTSVSVGADASTSIVPTNLSRKSLAITHASTSNLFISTGSASSTASFPVVANQVVGFDEYTGPVNAIAQEQAGTISVRYIEII